MNVNVKRYDVLDGMRGIAAIAVMLYHYSEECIFTHAFIAVDLFFILSGFVIAHSYGKKLADGKIIFSDFVYKRLIRLYPMVLAGVVLGTVAICLKRSAGLTDYSLREITVSGIYNLFLLPYFNEKNYGSLFPVDGCLWSLFFEIFANLFCIWLFRQTNGKLGKLAFAAYALILVQGLLAGFKAYYTQVIVSTGWSTDTFMAGFPRVFYGFILGILLYRLYNEKKWENLRKRASQFPPLVAFALLLLLLSLPYEYRGLYYMLAIGAAAPLFVLTGAMMECRGTIILHLSRLLGWLSYPIYCLHTPVLNFMEFTFKKFHMHQDYLIITSVSVTLAISAILTRFYEEPVRTYLTMRLRKAQQDSKNAAYYAG